MQDGRSVGWHEKVNPGGPNTAIGIRIRYRFEYREVGAAAWIALSSDKDAGNGFASVPVTEALDGLEADTAYEARLVASKEFSGVESVETATQPFTTPTSAPTSIWPMSPSARTPQRS